MSVVESGPAIALWAVALVFRGRRGGGMALARQVGRRREVYRDDDRHRHLARSQQGRLYPGLDVDKPKKEQQQTAAV